jgi:hypothetical protein
LDHHSRQSRHDDLGHRKNDATNESEDHDVLNERLSPLTPELPTPGTRHGAIVRILAAKEVTNSCRVSDAISVKKTANAVNVPAIMSHSEVI